MPRSRRSAQAIDELRESSRSISKAGAISGGKSQPSFGNPEDLFFWAVWAARNTRFPEFHAEGKALLEQMDTQWADVPAYSKATLGDSAGAGGNIVPPNVLEGVIKIATAVNIYRNLLNVVDAGFVVGVDIPTEGLAPVRATVQAYGATKTNINLTVAKYTATMYTAGRDLRHRQPVPAQLARSRREPRARPPDAGDGAGRVVGHPQRHRHRRAVRAS